MSFFSDTQNDTSIEQKDTVGGGYKPLPSGVYRCVISQAYGVESAQGAKGVALRLKAIDHDNREIRETIYVTRSKKNGGGNTYKNKAGKVSYLPGFELVDSLVELVNDQHLSQVETDSMMVNVWDAKSRKEIPTEVPMLVDLIDKAILVGLQEQKSNKNVKTTKGYVPSDEYRVANAIDRFFHPKTSCTALEQRAEGEAVLIEDWKKLYEDKVVDKTVEPEIRSGEAATGSSAAASSASDNTSSMYQ